MSSQPMSWPTGRSSATTLKQGTGPLPYGSSTACDGCSGRSWASPLIRTPSRCTNGVLAMEGRDVPPPAERARALLAWGVVHWERSELAEAERTAVEVRALAMDAGLGRELSDASELLGLVAYAQGRWREVFGREFLESVERNPELAPFVFDANLCMSEFALEESDGVRAMG